jgi:hypothetical protein
MRVTTSLERSRSPPLSRHLPPPFQLPHQHITKKKENKKQKKNEPKLRPLRNLYQMKWKTVLRTVEKKKGISKFTARHLNSI